MTKIRLFLILLFCLIPLTVYAQVWDVLNEPFNNLDDWYFWSEGTGVASIETFDEQETIKLDTGDDVWSMLGGYIYLEDIPDNFTTEIKLYHNASLGTFNDYDNILIYICNGEIQFLGIIAIDGLFIFDGDNYNEAGTNLVQTEVQQTWRFVVTGTGATATCDIYLDNVLKVSNFDCSNANSSLDGYVLIYQYGYTTTNIISYADYMKIATGLYVPVSPAAGQFIFINE